MLNFIIKAGLLIIFGLSCLLTGAGAIVVIAGDVSPHVRAWALNTVICGIVSAIWSKEAYKDKLREEQKND